MASTPGKPGGVFQRASIITGFAWLTALSARTLRRSPARAAHVISRWR
jgi:hypothetical protein